MPTPEGAVKRKVSALLKKHHPKVFYHMPVVSGYGKPSLDYIGCVGGRFFGIETKKPGGKPTERQELTMSEMRAAGAETFVVSCDEELAQLEKFIVANT